MKKILIIGNSLSAWSVASAFINKKVNITIIGNKNNTFGAQQLSPNGCPFRRSSIHFLH